MNFIVSAATDIGTTKTTNQDSLTVKILNTGQGTMVFAVLCDGMGGLAKGEVASATVIKAFDNWMINELPLLCNAPLEDSVIKNEWNRVITEQNNRIKAYGAKQGVRLGTTAVVMLITQRRYYIMNVGDSRAYELTDNIRRLTEDQTFVAREVALGNMTEAEAEVDERRSVLLQCVGASDEVYPDMFFGDTKENAVYLLCSDGFRHEISGNEIYASLQPNLLRDEATMQQNAINLIELNKQREERDNISVVLIRTF